MHVTGPVSEQPPPYSEATEADVGEQEIYRYEDFVDDELLSQLHRGGSYNEHGGDNELLDIGADRYSYEDDLFGEDDDDDDQLLVLERQLQQEEDDANPGYITTGLDMFGIFLVRKPHRYFPGSILVLFFLTIAAISVGIVSYKYHPPQEFIDAILQDATEGFETRGTYIKKGMYTARELYSQLLKGEKYSPYPNITLAFEKLNIDANMAQLLLSGSNHQFPQKKNKNGDESHKKQRLKRSATTTEKTTTTTTTSSTTAQAPTDNLTTKHYYSEPKKDGIHRFNQREDAYLKQDASKYYKIGDPHSFYVFVFEAQDSATDLYSYDAMMDMCKVENEQVLPLFGFGATYEVGYQSVYSLPRIITNYYRKKNCSKLTQQDLDGFRNLLSVCLNSFSYLFEEGQSPVDGNSINGGTAGNHHKHIPGTTTPDPATIPQKCQDSKDMILEIREFIVNKQFSNITTSTSTESQQLTPLTHSGLFVVSVGVKDGDALQFYHDYVEEHQFKSGGVIISAVNFQDENVKLDLFQEYFINDTLWFGLAFGLVFVVMLGYLWRLDLIICTVFCVCYGFIFAYAIYYFMLKMKFFPFINLLALLVLIAVGADDVFVFFDIFSQIQGANPHLPLEKIISKTFSHAVLSVFVTSLTTAAAFFANSISNITAIKVFGIFAGIAIIMNFLVMVLLIPSVIVLVELVWGFCFPRWELFKKERILSKFVGFRNVFQKFFPMVIDRTWFVWLAVLSILGISSGIIVFVKPRFKLPESNDFQVFPTSNVIENWDKNIKNNFYFALDESSDDLVTAYYIWGFKNIDGGNHWDPNNKTTTLIEDPSFNLYAPESQNWIASFCQDTKDAPYMPDYFHDWAICSLDAYSRVATQICNATATAALMQKYLPICCETQSVPFNSTQLEVCLPAYQAILFQQIKLPIRLNISGGIFGDVIYDVSTNRAVGYLLITTTKWQATFKYHLMENYYDILANQFIERLKASAPETLKNGFAAFREALWLYDLQHSLATGTYYSIGLSLSVAFLVMLLTSLNVLVTIYAMVTITLAILCTVACLVLMDWHLNIIESVIISLSVGLSIDFTIHYGVSYRISKSKDPKLRVNDSFRQVGAAVFMAALTTFLAGASLMPCRVLPYTKLGIFLMLVMSFAWIFANFFFQSLCRVVGPRGNFCQISTICKTRKKEDRVDNYRSGGSRTGGYGEPHGSLTLRRVDSDDSLLVTF